MGSEIPRNAVMGEITLRYDHWGWAGWTYHEETIRFGNYNHSSGWDTGGSGSQLHSITASAVGCSIGESKSNAIVSVYARSYVRCNGSWGDAGSFGNVYPFGK